MKKHPQAINDYIEGWIKRDAELLASSFNDTGLYIDNPHPITSKDRIVNFMNNVAWRNFPDMTFDTASLYGNGERYTWEWIMHVSSCGIIYGTKNKLISIPGVDLLEINNGKIEKAVAYFDRKALWDAILN